MTTPTRFQASESGGLSTDMTNAWERDGFLILENFATPEQCRALLDRAVTLIEGFEPGEAPSVFSSTSTTHARDDYFRQSGDKIRFFLEEEAEPDGPFGSVNKIGHALHDLDPVFDAFSRSRRLAAVARDLDVAAPLLLQSMVIGKPPRIGGEVTCHQDSTFLFTEPESCVGFWFALEDATLENGCLWAIPSAHRGPLKSRFRERDGVLVTEALDASPWPMDRKLPLEAPAGSLIILHGRLPHLSEANRSAKSRLAYTLHLIDGATRFAEDNWLRRAPDMPLRGFGDLTEAE